MTKQFELLEGSQPKPIMKLEVQDWIVFHLAELLEVDPNEIDVTTPFGRYGLDSSEAIGMTGELEDWLGKELHPTLLYDYPTIEKLAEYVVSSN